mgnify:CR=1 FL=1
MDKMPTRKKGLAQCTADEFLGLFWGMYSDKGILKRPMSPKERRLTWPEFTGHLLDDLSRDNGRRYYRALNASLNIHPELRFLPINLVCVIVSFVSDKKECVNTLAGIKEAVEAGTLHPCENNISETHYYQLCKVLSIEPRHKGVGRLVNLNKLYAYCDLFSRVKEFTGADCD